MSTENIKKFIVKYLNRFVFFKSDMHSVQDLLFYYSLTITFVIAFVSLISNLILGLPLVVNLLTILGMMVTAALFVLAYYKRKVKLAQNIFLVYLALSLNILWLFTQGSAGSTITILQGIMVIVVFYESTKTIKLAVIGIFINVLALFAIEIYAPELIVKYTSDQQRTLDILVVTLMFFVFMLPVLLLAKKAIIRERNEAVRSEAIKTSFFLSLSHEIRTPMNAILGFSELLEDDGLTNAQKMQYLGIINQNGRTLLNLLNNVISFSKLESNQNTISISPINADELVQQVYYSLQQLIDEKKPIDFKMNCPATSAVLQTDVLKAYQILLNITFNAIKFTNEGFVEIGYFQLEKSVTFYVMDTGCGISESNKIDIFDRFMQAGQTLKSSTHHGAGLGLAICKRLSKLINAQITFESQLGKGTTFFVSIPKRPDNISTLLSVDKK